MRKGIPMGDRRIRCGGFADCSTLHDLHISICHELLECKIPQVLWGQPIPETHDSMVLVFLAPGPFCPRLDAYGKVQFSGLEFQPAAPTAVILL